MGDYRLSPRAQADVDDIWDWTATRWGLDQAERYIRGLQAAIDSLADNPAEGRSCKHIRAGYRRRKVGSHAIFYRIEPGRIEIVRVLHDRMDLKRHL